MHVRYKYLYNVKDIRESLLNRREPVGVAREWFQIGQSKSWFLLLWQSVQYPESYTGSRHYVRLSTRALYCTNCRALANARTIG